LAIFWALASSPPFRRKDVIPVARKVWQQERHVLPEAVSGQTTRARDARTEER
jgi:hypothetical protein